MLTWAWEQAHIDWTFSWYPFVALSPDSACSFLLWTTLAWSFALTWAGTRLTTWSKDWSAFKAEQNHAHWACVTASRCCATSLWIICCFSASCLRDSSVRLLSILKANLDGLESNRCRKSWSSDVPSMKRFRSWVASISGIRAERKDHTWLKKTETFRTRVSSSGLSLYFFFCAAPMPTVALANLPRTFWKNRCWEAAVMGKDQSTSQRLQIKNHMRWKKEKQKEKEKEKERGKEKGKRERERRKRERDTEWELLSMHWSCLPGMNQVKELLRRPHLPLGRKLRRSHCKPPIRWSIQWSKTSWSWMLHQKDLNWRAGRGLIWGPPRTLQSLLNSSNASLLAFSWHPMRLTPCQCPTGRVPKPAGGSCKFAGHLQRSSGELGLRSQPSGSRTKRKMIPVALLQPSSETQCGWWSILTGIPWHQLPWQCWGCWERRPPWLEQTCPGAPHFHGAASKEVRQSRQSLLLTSFDFHLRSTKCQIRTGHHPKVPAAIARTVPRPTHPAMWPHDIGFIVFHPIYSVRLIHN